MKDQLSVERLKQLHPKAISIFQQFIEECESSFNVTLRIMLPVFRSIAEQDALYAQGRTKPGKIVTNAKGGSSFHNYGLAVDLCSMIDDEEQVDWNFNMGKLQATGNKYGLVWGGSWKTLKDYPHFEKTFGYTWQQLYTKYQKKDFISGTQFLNI